MRKLIVSTVVFLMGYAEMISVSLADPTRTFPCLPKAYRDQVFQKCEAGFKERSDKLLTNKKYQNWSMNRNKEDILEEFNKLNEWREHVWYVNPAADTLESQKDFMISQDLLINHRYRKPHLIAFAYNNTDASYNSDTVILNGLKFLALEAPSKASIENFLNLMQNFQVTHLVRLTPAAEGGHEKSYPYWQGNVETNASTQESFLKIPLESEESEPLAYKLRYVWTNEWKDHASGSADELLSLILQARKGHTPSSLIAVHCHSGVARTGTFIAGFILLNDIDQQIAKGVKPADVKVSIEKTVAQLSLQRFYMVGKPAQYLTLHRLVDLYVQELQTGKKAT
ncbi:MAG: hypothetical protein HYX35_00765 [Proteobacteria bacterium]|nr:hypothetical protein [Pseudomonadota bacterium]